MRLETTPWGYTLACMSRLAQLFLTVFLALTAFGLLVPAPRCLAQAPAAEKLALRILYVGHAGSEREADFVAFLRQHFRQVSTGNLASFDAKQAVDADVILFDYDGDGFKAPQPKLAATYARPTVTIGVAGGLWASRQRLKTGYL